MCFYLKPFRFSAPFWLKMVLCIVYKNLPSSEDPYLFAHDSFHPSPTQKGHFLESDLYPLPHTMSPSYCTSWYTQKSVRRVPNSYITTLHIIVFATLSSSNCGNRLPSHPIGLWAVREKECRHLIPTGNYSAEHNAWQMANMCK